MSDKTSPENNNNEVSFEDFLMMSAMQVDALCQLLIEKGIIGEEELYSKIQQIQKEYEGEDEV